MSLFFLKIPIQTSGRYKIIIKTKKALICFFLLYHISKHFVNRYAIFFVLFCIFSEARVHQTFHRRNPRLSHARAAWKASRAPPFLSRIGCKVRTAPRMQSFLPQRTVKERGNRLLLRSFESRVTALPP
jgi:hypothetical protein